ncbi:DUF3995 domain-containing protein [Georgenia faecalis]|uniref:DUF3995 domain-containing protein n=1 Tax=Georgenia faecalis TaxID=2483799 RepID=A0ABV9DDC3_9MICO|nr:DUF3995 domain-containing protein [Georgenia faecalis]
MGSPRRARASRVCLGLACAAGLVHAAFSLYWAVGGTWLLDTVGQWAVRLHAEAPLQAGLVLAAVALAKAAGAVVPVLVDRQRIGGRAFWRALSWVGAVALVAYGGVNTLVSNAVLAGVIRPDGGYDRPAMIGHAWLWDPLFLVWGAALLAHLWLTRPGRGAAARTRRGA